MIDVPVGIVTNVTVDIVIEVPVVTVDVMIDAHVSIVFGVPIVNRGAMITDAPVHMYMYQLLFLYWLMNSH